MTDTPRTAAGRALLDELWPQGEPTMPKSRNYGTWFARKAIKAYGQDLQGILAIEAEAAAPTPAEPLDVLRQAATDVLHSWDAGDIDQNYDRIASAFDSLRESLAAARPEAER